LLGGNQAACADTRLPEIMALPRVSSRLLSLDVKFQASGSSPETREICPSGTPSGLTTVLGFDNSLTTTPMDVRGRGDTPRTIRRIE